MDSVPGASRIQQSRKRPEARMVLRRALLGLLAASPATGLALQRRFADLAAFAWSARHPQIYKELASMLREGLIEQASSGPRRSKVYAVTEAGRNDLRDWLTNTEPDPTVRNEAKLRTLFLWLLPRSEMLRVLREEAAQHRTRLARLQTLAETFDANPSSGGPDRFARIALEYGLRLEQMSIDWTDWARVRLLAFDASSKGTDRLQRDLVRKIAPGRLQVVQEFLNTAPILLQPEQLATPEHLEKWLVEHGLASSIGTISTSDLTYAHLIRKALRELVDTNRGGVISAGSRSELVRASAAANLQFDFDGRTHLVLRGGASGLQGAVGSMLAFVHEAMLTGEWARFKTCANCGWSFFDTSDGSDEVWCSDLACGLSRGTRKAPSTRAKSPG
jgi:DNA-binding PadR family transcriptional regulator/predicted RNA-binding Zn ribbon-like protein